MAYRVRKAYQHLTNLRTVIDGVLVALVEPHTHTKKGTVTSPPKTVQVPMATPAQLKAIFDRGDPVLEKYEEEKAVESKEVEHAFKPQKGGGAKTVKQETEQISENSDEPE